MLRTPITAALLLLSLSACGPSDPWQSTSSALAGGVLLPAYNHWLSANQQLASDSQSFCAGNRDLAAMRQTWLNAQSAWSALQPMLLGPLSEGNRAWQVQFWPDKKNLVARQVESLLLSNPTPSPADLDKASVVVQGLSASEYVLFDSAIDLNQNAQKTRYCPLLIAIGAHQQALASDILNQWQSSDGTLAQLQSFPNTRYADSNEAITDVLRIQVTSLEGIKKKLGTPLGRQSKGVPQPFQAEAWRSNASLGNLIATLNSAEQVWLGSHADGLRKLLGSQSKELAGRIDAAYQDSRKQLAAQQQPLSQLLSDEVGRQQLNALYDSLNTLHRLHETELAKALGIQLGFNANDGD